MFAGTGNAGTVATSGSAGWGRGSWLRRSSFAESRDTNRPWLSSKNWKLWRRLSRRLSNGERRRKVDHKGAATFNGVPGILTVRCGCSALSQSRDRISFVSHSWEGDGPRASNRASWGDTEIPAEGGRSGVGHRRGTQDGKSARRS